MNGTCYENQQTSHLNSKSCPIILRFQQSSLVRRIQGIGTGKGKAKALIIAIDESDSDISIADCDTRVDFLSELHNEIEGVIFGDMAGVPDPWDPAYDYIPFS